ncbi:MAG: Polya polymerase [Oscillospiraceae bacterium]
MKLYDIDVIRLIELLDKAKGNVYLVTEDGNKLNLKSKLCQLYGVRALLEKTKNSTISAELNVENPEDELMFINYMMSK